MIMMMVKDKPEQGQQHNSLVVLNLSQAKGSSSNTKSYLKMDLLKHKSCLVSEKKKGPDRETR